MGFSLKSLFGLLFYVLWPFPLQSLRIGRSFTILASSSAVSVNVFWFALSGSRLCNYYTLILDKKKKTSMFNFVLG
ncbi:hypothetical protein LV92_03870 [Arenibacter echinorum]|uniref:Uncharacterized protein n=1 Tax=Arenibacter echinorum TaxID=440515 RepID=A0A327QT73_9FLAO|nr:hypothetical protein LV92_03870 [Arenibacter echinorum]